MDCLSGPSVSKNTSIPDISLSSQLFYSICLSQLLTRTLFYTVQSDTVTFLLQLALTDGLILEVESNQQCICFYDHANTEHSRNK